MSSTFIVIVTAFVLVVGIILVYCIGLILPESHIVSRKIKYNTTPEVIWSILTQVQNYPSWRSNIKNVTVRADELNTFCDDRITFIELSKTNRRTVVIHVEQEYQKRLLRVLEERPCPGLEAPPRKPTFSGSWTFLIEPVEGEKTVFLTITEQGVITKPLVRFSLMIIFGYEQRMKRFMKDLGKAINIGKFDSTAEENKQPIESKTNIIDEEEFSISKERTKNEIKYQDDEEEYQAPPDSSFYHDNNTFNSMSDSRFIDKEWDIINDD